MAKKKHRLRKLSISEISLVDEPANPGAAVLFYKRKGGHEGGENQETDIMTLEELAKALEEAQATIETKDEEIASVTKRAEAAEAEVAGLKKAKDEPGEEDIFKGMSPAAVEIVKGLQETNKKQGEALAKMASDRREAEFVKQAEGFENLPVKAGEFGPLLKRLADRETAEGDMDKLAAVLKAADAAFAKATTERGLDSGMAETEIEAKVNKLAEDRAAKDGITYAKAYQAVLEDNPELYNQLLDA